jgi:hypothetical protein
LFSAAAGGEMSSDDDTRLIGLAEGVLRNDAPNESTRIAAIKSVRSRQWQSPAKVFRALQREMARIHSGVPRPGVLILAATDTTTLSAED